MSTAAPTASAMPRRARTQAQKTARRQAILDVADAYFRESGFEAFSMAELAKRAGVAKGTLYLYFETREEVLLALYVELLDDWRQAFCAGLAGALDDEAFVRLFFDTSRADPAFLTVVSRMDSVIEHNVSREKLIESKRALAATLERIFDEAAGSLRLPPEKAAETIRALAFLVLGASQLDKGPALEEMNLPEDVRAFATSFSSESIFLPNALRIIAGIRSGN